ncbi:MAG TPA: Spy/CpxP family protein refolding chaperone [Gemmatimonadaceae bacterium]
MRYGGFVRGGRLVAALALGIALALAPSRAWAQEPEGRDTLPAARSFTPDSTAPDESSPERRELEQRLRQRIAQVVQARLALTDDQLGRLQRVNQRYEGRRRDLVRTERSLRLSLRAELLRGDQADQGRVGALLDQLVQVQQSRLDIFREEQHDLSAFLTPVQRAKYAALQEQLRKRIGELRERRSERRQLRRGPRRRPQVPAGDGPP